MKEKMLRSIWLRVCMIAAVVTTAFAGSAWANEPITVELEGFSAYNGQTGQIEGQIDGNISFETTNGSVSNSNLTFETLTLMAKNNAKINAVTFHYASDDGVNAQWVFDGSTAYFYVNGSANSPTISEKSCDNIVIRPSYTGNSLVMDYISVTYTPGDPAYTITALSSNTYMGAVEPDGNVIIATPNHGYAVDENTPYTVTTEGTATVVRKGNYFAVVPPSDDCTITINFVAHAGSTSLDFEKSLNNYTDWNIQGFERTKSDWPNPHGGTYMGKTTTTQPFSIQTAEKIEYPETFSCWICPLSDASSSPVTWKVQVFSPADDSDWRDVGDPLSYTVGWNSEYKKNTWYSISVDLSSEIDVYVRLYYSGGNAAAVDDIDLTERAATVKVSVSSYGYSTFCCHKALDFTNSSINVYYAEATGSTLTFHQIKKVPADTGVLLQKANGVTNEEVPALVETPDEVPNTNVFVPGTGAAVSWSATDQNYILYHGDIYQADNNKVAKNRAYIHLPDGNQVKDFTINLDDDDTGIETIDDAQPTANDAIYNLAGQRLKKMQKGINIVNGKKMIQR